MKISIKNIRISGTMFITAFFVLILINAKSEAQNGRVWLTETQQQIIGPTDTTEIANWQKQIEQWRKIEKTKLAFRDTHYNDKEIQWVRDDFIQTQLMVQERSFYNPAKNEYTVDKYLKEITAR